MGLNNTGLNVAVDAVTAVAVYASLHTADPGATGTNEATGGTPAYARKLVTWGAAAAGSASATGTPVCQFDAPAGTYTHVGFWSAVTAGTFYGSDDFASSIVLGAQGTIDVDTASLAVT